MPVTIHPRPGQILDCDFSQGFKPPEMVKRRPVVIVACRFNGLCTVVPISTQMPHKVEPCHILLPHKVLPQLGRFQEKENWVKADMLYSVGLQRLDLIRLGKRRTDGKREYFTSQLSREMMASIYGCVLNGLGLPDLAKHL